MIKEMFKTQEVTKVLRGVSRNLLSQWHKRGQVKSVVQPKRQGAKNFYSIENICQIELFRRLNEKEFTRKKASEFAFNEKTEAAFRLVRNRGGVNDLAKFYYGVCVLGDKVYKINPMSGESTGRRMRHPSPMIKMIFYTFKDNLESDFFDMGYLDELDPELLAKIQKADDVLIIDLLKITIDVLEGIQKMISQGK